MRVGWKIILAAVIFLVISCGVAPLYEKAEIKQGWDKHIGLMYQDYSIGYTLLGEAEYQRYQIMRFDIVYSYGYGQLLAIIPRAGLGLVHRRDIRADGRWEYTGGVTAGLGLKATAYRGRTFSFSIKYDVDFTFGAHNIFLLAGIKKNNKEVFTLSFYTPSVISWDVRRRAASGLNVAYHFSDKTLIAGSNFFFTQDLSREAEPYIVFWFGVGVGL